MTNPAFLTQAAADLEAAALDIARRMETPILQLKAATRSIERLAGRLDESEGVALHLRQQLEDKEEVITRQERLLKLRDDEILSLKRQLHQMESHSRRAR